MTCAAVRQHLLASERPDQPGPDQAGHLAGCAACRAWLSRLVRLERQLSQVPVPPCPPPPALWERLRGKGATPPPVPPVLVRPPIRQVASPRRRSEGARQKLALAFSLAATLTLFTIGWWAWPQDENRAPVKRVAARNVWEERRDEVVRQAPRDRPIGLVLLAHKVLREASEYGHEPEKVAELAGHFEVFVQRDLLRYTRELSATDRQEVLPKVVKSLHNVESHASRLVTDWDTKYKESAGSIRRMVAAAQTALTVLERA